LLTSISTPHFLPENLSPKMSKLKTKLKIPEEELPKGPRTTTSIIDIFE